LNPAAEPRPEHYMLLQGSRSILAKIYDESAILGLLLEAKQIYLYQENEDQ